MSLTLSAIAPFALIAEVTGEFRLPADFSVAAVAGLGVPGGVQWQAAVQGRYYLLGGFEHGMPLGVEALYVDGPDQAGKVGGGPFVGYKLATNIGFTVDVNVGFEYMVGLPSAKYEDEDDGDGVYKGFWPLLNANVGWSF